MDETQRRKAANESLFREINERVEQLHRTFALTQQDDLHIVCECDRLDCSEGLDVPVPIYEATRQNPHLFFVSPGHEDDAVEDVVDTGSGYVIVRKRPGEPQAIAEQTDPRS
jgi:hypothetical protein